MIAVEQIDDLILCCWGFECGGDTTRNVGTADVESIASRELRSDLSAGGQIREPTGAQSPLERQNITESNPLARSLAYSVERESPLSVVNPIWLLAMMWSVPPVEYPRSRARLSVSATTPWPMNDASP